MEREQVIKALERLVEKCDENCRFYTSAALCDALSIIKELTEENEMLAKHNAVLIEDKHILATEFKEKTIADTVQKMQSEIEARCIKGGIYPAFVKSTIDQIAEEIIGGSYGKKD